MTLAQQVLTSIPSPPQGVWHLGPLPIRAYALAILTGIVVALLLTRRRWVERGGDADTVLEIVFWAVPFGIVGGRIYHVLSSPDAYFGPDGDPMKAFAIWEGGLGIWGAIATGLFVNIDVNSAIPALTMFPGGSYYYAKVVAGEISPLTNQIIAVGITVVLSAVASAVILTIIKVTIGLRVNEEEEERGLDLAQHGEEGYNNVM